MKKEDKQLLLQDLCGRLPYLPICHIAGENGAEIDDILTTSTINNFDVWVVKPYLRPMPSMTDEEREDFWKNVLDIDWHELEFDEEPDEVPFPFTENDCGFYLDFIYLADLFAVFDWLNEHHFDFRNLIKRGLAIDCTGLNIY